LSAEPPESVIPQALDGSPTNLSEATVEKALPKEYAEFKQVLRRDFGTNDVSAALRLVDAAREALLKTAPDGAEQKAAMDTYRGAWRLALRIYLGAKESAATNQFVSEWSKRLRERDILVASQLYALARVWDAKLLTPEFWEVISQTDSHRIANAVAWLMYKRADDVLTTRIGAVMAGDRKLARADYHVINLAENVRRAELAHGVFRPPSGRVDLEFDFY